MTEMNPFKLRIPDYDHPVAARYRGTVPANDRDPVTDESVESYHSVDIRHPTGEWENLWLLENELLDYLRSAQDYQAVDALLAAERVGHE